MHLPNPVAGAPNDGAQQPHIRGGAGIAIGAVETRFSADGRRSRDCRRQNEQIESLLKSFDSTSTLHFSFAVLTRCSYCNLSTAHIEEADQDEEDNRLAVSAEMRQRRNEVELS